MDGQDWNNNEQQNWNNNEQQNWSNNEQQNWNNNEPQNWSNNEQQNWNNSEQQNTANYQDNAYQYYQGQAPMQANQRAGGQQSGGSDALAIVSLIFGIFSILLCWCSPAALVAGIIAIVCAVLARKQRKSGMATAGLICGIIGCLISVIIIALYGASFLGLFLNHGVYERDMIEIYEKLL